MKKRRSTVYVRPGKDITLYIPAETPPEVIDYLNRLKDEGNFSQGVVDILTEYVTAHLGRQQLNAGAPSPEAPQAQVHSSAAAASAVAADGAASPGSDGTATSDVRELASGAPHSATAQAADPAHAHSAGEPVASTDKLHATPSAVEPALPTPASAAPAAEPQASPVPERKKLSLAQIFRQAQRNAGRLTDG
ncbi:hypothetical protein [Alicyclobacillus kakegawensis]|uniref:hypothetical protein n=1 Tax=Alicyclobacillus kakegawensis TaxID=392012 RepID=UPI000832E005|nr:hypothetical protein [Alicyclobacillus kakegawensis]